MRPTCTNTPRRRWLGAWSALILLFGSVALVLARPTVATASCAASASVQDAVRSAPFVFVGTVTGLSSGDRAASVHVDDVWRGDGITSAVEVVGTPDLNAAATSVDRTYTSDAQYLFVPDGGGPERFTDNSCTATQLYSPALAALRPASAHGAPTATGAGFPVVAVLVVGLVVLAGGGAAMALRQRTRRVRSGS